MGQYAFAAATQASAMPVLPAACRLNEMVVTPGWINSAA